MLASIEKMFLFPFPFPGLLNDIAVVQGFQILIVHRRSESENPLTGFVVLKYTPGRAGVPFHCIEYKIFVLKKQPNVIAV